MSDQLRDCFDTFTREAFRIETLQAYEVPQETEVIASWRRGEPQPERSARTSPWLRRIATGVTVGRAWRRVHVVDLPLSEYLRWELEGYQESCEAGEQIKLLDRAQDTSKKMHDFWLFDGKRAVDMHYDPCGRLLGDELITSPGEVKKRCAIRDEVWGAGVPLHDWLTAQQQSA